MTCRMPSSLLPCRDGVNVLICQLWTFPRASSSNMVWGGAMSLMCCSFVLGLRVLRRLLLACVLHQPFLYTCLCLVGGFHCRLCLLVSPGPWRSLRASSLVSEVTLVWARGWCFSCLTARYSSREVEYLVASVLLYIGVVRITVSI